MIQGSGDPYAQLIAQIIRLERRPQQALRDQKSAQQTLRATLTDFDSSLSALRRSVRTLRDAFTNPFAARKASAPDDAPFRVTASDRAAGGAHTLAVERLAAADTRISQRFDAAGGALRTFFAEHGAQTFTVEVAAPTDDEPDRRVAVAVTVEPDLSEDPSDRDLLETLQRAIRDAVDEAVTDGRLERRFAPSTSVAQETTASARLSLRSGQTGYSHRLAFSDSADGLLALLQVDRETLAGTAAGAAPTGGAVFALGTGPEDSALNARFALDGLTLFRDGNAVEDALPGVSLTLTATGPATAFSVTSDGDAVARSVDDFIKQYNAVVEFVNRRSQVDASGGKRGPFAGDASVQGFRRGAREDLIREVAGQPEGLAALRDLGIEIERDGKLTLKHRDALTAAAERDPDAVQRLFAAEDGIATRLERRADTFLGAEGLLRGRRTATDAAVRRLDARIKVWDERLAIRESQLQKQFAKLQETSALVNSQFNALSPFLYAGF